MLLNVQLTNLLCSAKNLQIKMREKYFVFISSTQSRCHRLIFTQFSFHLFFLFWCDIFSLCADDFMLSQEKENTQVQSNQDQRTDYGLQLQFYEDWFVYKKFFLLNHSANCVGRAQMFAQCYFTHDPIQGLRRWLFNLFFFTSQNSHFFLLAISTHHADSR